MKKKILWITRTAVVLALLLTVQVTTKAFGQMVTGSCVNFVLATSVLLAGLPCGLVVALVSPVLAFLLGIAPQVLTVPAIMAGNSVFVLLLYWIADPSGKRIWRQITAWLVSAAAKFATLYGIVSLLICGVFARNLLASGALKPAMLQVLPATFGVPQLITALIGGAVALILCPVLQKAICR